MTMCYDNHGNYLAAGYFDGSVKIFNTISGKVHTLLKYPTKNGDADQDPVTCLRYRPCNVNEGQCMRATLTAVSAGGIIQHW